MSESKNKNGQPSSSKRRRVGLGAPTLGLGGEGSVALTRVHSTSIATAIPNHDNIKSRGEVFAASALLEHILHFLSLTERAATTRTGKAAWKSSAAAFHTADLVAQAKFYKNWDLSSAVLGERRRRRNEPFVVMFDKAFETKNAEVFLLLDGHRAHEPNLISNERVVVALDSVVAEDSEDTVEWTACVCALYMKRCTNNDFQHLFAPMIRVWERLLATRRSVQTVFQVVWRFDAMLHGSRPLWSTARNTWASAMLACTVSESKVVADKAWRVWTELLLPEIIRTGRTCRYTLLDKAHVNMELPYIEAFAQRFRYGEDAEENGRMARAASLFVKFNNALVEAKVDMEALVLWRGKTWYPESKVWTVTQQDVARAMTTLLYLVGEASSTGPGVGLGAGVGSGISSGSGVAGSYAAASPDTVQKHMRAALDAKRIGIQETTNLVYLTSYRETDAKHFYVKYGFDWSDLARFRAHGDLFRKELDRRFLEAWNDESTPDDVSDYLDELYRAAHFGRNYWANNS